MRGADGSADAAAAPSAAPPPPPPASSPCAPPLWCHGVHLENSLLLSLFALLMWDCIFAPLPAAFGSPLQDAPDDLLAASATADGRPAFVSRRRALIDASLRAIEGASTAEEEEEAGEAAAAEWR